MKKTFVSISRHCEDKEQVILQEFQCRKCKGILDFVFIQHPYDNYYQEVGYCDPCALEYKKNYLQKMH